MNRILSSPALSRSSMASRMQLAEIIRLCLLVSLLPDGNPAIAAKEVSFRSDVLPILSTHCFECHGPDPDSRQGGFRLDQRESALADTGDTPGIRPGFPERSAMIQRILSSDPDQRMPPPESGRRLNPAEINQLRTWIEAGAKYERHWAYEPVSRIQSEGEATTGTREIDRLLKEQLDVNGLEFATEVPRRVLIRRATFDLTGLPPTWQEVRDFEMDTRPDAFEHLLDRLLASPRYGERWGRYWLDLARYADTHGGGAIGFTRFPFSYTYRDYVIRAFNDDLPYDKFLIEQIAADQLDRPGTDPSLAALGFLTVGRQYRNQHDVIDDRIDVVTRGVLGLTVACARCHDHKYDAISTKDYYSLYATFGASRAEELLPEIGDQEPSEALDSYRDELARRQRKRNETRREQNVIMRNRLRMQVGMYLREIVKGTPEQDLSSAFLSFRTDDMRPLILERWRNYVSQMPHDEPVFGPWQQLASLPAEKFKLDAPELITGWVEQNGTDGKATGDAPLNSTTPRWNPRVLESLQAAAPTTMLEVADAYGKLFATVQREWLTSLLETAEEAAPEGSVVPDLDARHGSINSAVNRQIRRHLHADGTPTVMSDEMSETQLNRTVRDHVRGLSSSIHELHLNSPGSPPRAMSLRENPNPEPFHVLVRGNPLDRGSVVKPRFLVALTKGDPEIFADGQRRLGLARALVDPSNPLTRRVIVNWVWQKHFGLGLVRTPDDFGIRGEAPTHPALLDHLAELLRHDHWSLKSLHRRIMLTDAYRQAATENREARLKDPGNRLLWRMPRRRLDAEAMRDAMLAVSGHLDLTMGGRPFDLMKPEPIFRRTVYGFVNRDIVSSFASTFDMADPSACTAKRPRTTVPQQALFALNSDFIQEMARHFADRPELRKLDSDEDRIRWIYRTAFSRTPDADELQTALRFIRGGEKDKDGVKWQQLTHAVLAANEFLFLD